MRKVKAFTLIELLVVVVIIGVLAGLVVLSLNSSIKKSKDARAQDSVKKVQTVIALMLQESQTGNFAGTVLTPKCGGGGQNVLTADFTAKDLTKYFSAAPLDAVGYPIQYKCVKASSQYVIYGKSSSGKCWYVSDATTNIDGTAVDCDALIPGYTGI